MLALCSARRAILASAVVGLVGVLGSQAMAASATWSTTTTTGTWANDPSWGTGVAGSTPGSAGYTGSTDTATFGRNAVSAITVDANRNIQNITFNPTVQGSTTFGYAFSGGPLLLTSGGAITTGGTGLASSSFATALAIQGDGGTYSISADFASASRLLTISGAISGVSTATHNTALTLTGGSGGTHVVSGAITDGGAGGTLSVTKSGANTWQLTGTNTFTGGLTITGGTLITSNATPSSNLSSGAVTLNGGTLRLSATNSTMANAVVVGANGGFISTKATTFNSSVTGNGSLTFNEDAATVFTVGGSGLSTFTGTLNIGGAGSVRLGTSLTSFDAANALANLALNLNAGAYVYRGFGTNGVQTLNIGTLSGAAGTLTGGNSAGNGTLVYSVGARNEISTYSGVVTDGTTKTGFAKTGTAAMTLAGTNNYTGGTTISGGSLVTANASALGAGTVNVTGGGLKIGDGTTNTLGGITGLTMADTTTLALGSAASSVTLASGNFSIGAITLDLGNLFNTEGAYTLITGASGSTDTISPLVSIINADTANHTYSFALSGTNGVLTVSPVPEPASIALIGMGLLGMATRRRRA